MYPSAPMAHESRRVRNQPVPTHIMINAIMSGLRHVQNKRAAIMTLCFLFAAEWAKAQTIVHSFDGDRGPGLAACESGITHCCRPEMSVAANGTQVVQVTWQNFRIYDYNGHLVQSTPLSQIIRKAGQPGQLKSKCAQSSHHAGSL